MEKNNKKRGQEEEDIYNLIRKYHKFSKLHILNGF